MKHLNESILSKNPEIYKNTIRPYKSSVLGWLKENDFIERERYDYIGRGKRRDTLAKEKNDVYYCGPNNDGPFTDWIAIHTKYMYELVFWFGENGEIDNIELRDYPVGAHDLTFDDAVKKLLES